MESRTAIIPQFLLIAHSDIVVELLLCAPIPVDSLLNEHGFYRSVPEHNASSEKTVDNGEEDLYCAALVLHPACLLSGTYTIFSTWAPQKHL